MPNDILSPYISPLAAIAIVAAILVLVSLARRRVWQDGQSAILRRLEHKIDLLMKQAGVDYDPYRDAPQSVIDALLQGKGKIAAINQYRIATGTGLKESKDFVEEVMRRRGISS